MGVLSNCQCLHSMGLAGIRTADNMALFDANKPLVVVYYDVDYERNAKGDQLVLSVDVCYSHSSSS